MTQEELAYLMAQQEELEIEESENPTIYNPYAKDTWVVDKWGVSEL